MMKCEATMALQEAANHCRRRIAGKSVSVDVIIHGRSHAVRGDSGVVRQLKERAAQVFLKLIVSIKETKTMSSSRTDERVFKLHFPFTDPLRRSFFSLVEQPLSRMLSLNHLEGVYRDISERNDGRPFAERALERLNVSYRISSADRSRIATEGPLVIVANHPFGGIEGLVLAAALGPVRSDVKFMANYLLMGIPEIRDLMIAVDPFRGPDARARNTGPLRACLRWVRAGNTLVVFPAGEVARFDLRQGRVTDPAWNPAFAKFIRAAGYAKRTWAASSKPMTSSAEPPPVRPSGPVPASRSAEALLRCREAPFPCPAPSDRGRSSTLMLPVAEALRRGEQ